MLVSGRVYLKKKQFVVGKKTLAQFNAKKTGVQIQHQNKLRATAERGFSNHRNFSQITVVFFWG